MSKTAYTILTEEALVRYRAQAGEGAEIGASVSLDIPKDEETAVIAAGWLEHVTTKTAKEKE